LPGSPRPERRELVRLLGKAIASIERVDRGGDDD